MEELIALAALYIVGFDTWDTFLSRIDELYMKDPYDGELIYIESLTSKKDIIIHTSSLKDSDNIDINAYVDALMRYLSAEYYKSETNLSDFSGKAYKIWSGWMPFDVSIKEPYYLLCWADDLLPLGYEKNCRELYEKVFGRYKTQL